MTTAFIAEVDTKDGTMYVARKGELRKLPYFWRSGYELMKAMTAITWKHPAYFNWADNAEKTSVVFISDLHRGLRASKGEVMTVYAFKQHPRSMPASSRIKNPKNTIYKLKVKGVPKKFWGDGKYGKTWDSAGALRNHLTLNIDRLAKVYKDAEVVEITIGDDGLTQKAMKFIPVVQFYRSSPYSAKTFLNYYRQSLSQFDETVELRTDFA